MPEMTEKPCIFVSVTWASYAVSPCVCRAAGAFRNCFDFFVRCFYMYYRDVSVCFLKKFSGLNVEKTNGNVTVRR